MLPGARLLLSNSANSIKGLISSLLDARSQDEVVTKRGHGWINAVAALCRAGLLTVDRPDERILHGEYHVGVEILVAGEEDVSDQRLAAGVTDHEVHMCRAEWMSPLGLQHIADRPVVRDRIGGRYDGTEPEVTLCIRAKTGAACQPLQ